MSVSVLRYDQGREVSEKRYDWCEFMYKTECKTESGRFPIS